MGYIIYQTGWIVPFGRAGWLVWKLLASTIHLSIQRDKLALTIKFLTILVCGQKWTCCFGFCVVYTRTIIYLSVSESGYDIWLAASQLGKYPALFTSNSVIIVIWIIRQSQHRVAKINKCRPWKIGHHLHFTGKILWGNNKVFRWSHNVVTSDVDHEVSIAFV